MKIEVNENREILCSNLSSTPVIGQFNDVLVQDVPKRIAAANNLRERVHAILYGCNPDSLSEIVDIMRDLMYVYAEFKNEVEIDQSIN